MIDDAIQLLLTGLEALAWPVGDIDLVPGFSSGDPPELSRVYDQTSRAIADNPSDVRAYFTRAVVCQSKRWYPHALADVGEVLRRDAGHARAWLLLSEVLGSLGEHDRAKAARERALELDPALA